MKGIIAGMIFFSLFVCFGQRLVKIKMYVVPFSNMYRYRLSREDVSKLSEVIIQLKWYEDEDGLLDTLKELRKNKGLDAKKENLDYRIKLVVMKFPIGREVLYLNSYGMIYYCGRIYRSKFISRFVEELLPDKVKFF